MDIKKREELSKVSMCKISEDSLDRMLKKVNENYEGGRVSKNYLLSWIVAWFEEKAFEKQIESIRKKYFDELAYLESMVLKAKLARKNGQVVDLREQWVSKKSQGKKAAKISSERILA